MYPAPMPLPLPDQPSQRFRHRVCAVASRCRACGYLSDRACRPWQRHWLHPASPPRGSSHPSRLRGSAGLCQKYAPRQNLPSGVQKQSGWGQLQQNYAPSGCPIRVKRENKTRQPQDSSPWFCRCQLPCERHSAPRGPPPGLCLCLRYRFHTLLSKRKASEY